MLMKMLFKGFIAQTVIMGVLVIVGQFMPTTEWGPPFLIFGFILIPAGVVGSLVSFGILYLVWGWVPWRDRDKRAGKVSLRQSGQTRIAISYFSPHATMTKRTSPLIRSGR